MKKRIILPVLLALIVGGLVLPSESSALSKRYANDNPRYVDTRCNFADRFQDKLFDRFDQDNDRILGWLQHIISYENTIPCEPTENIVETLVNNDNFSTLVAAVTAADLVDALDGPEEITVFAPTNQAFEKLPEGTVEALLGDIPTLTSILTYHVVEGAVPAEVAVTLTSAPTVNGDTIDISLDDGKLFIDESQVILYDIKTTNGIIHVLDTVLIP